MRLYRLILLVCVLIFGFYSCDYSNSIVDDIEISGDWFVTLTDLSGETVYGTFYMTCTNEKIIEFSTEEDFNNNTINIQKDMISYDNSLNTCVYKFIKSESNSSYIGLYQKSDWVIENGETYLHIYGMYETESAASDSQIVDVMGICTKLP